MTPETPQRTTRCASAIQSGLVVLILILFQITDFPSFYATEMDSLFSAVEQAYANGLTGTHIFFNVPPEERSPSGLLSSQHNESKANIELYNAQLASRVSQFAANHTDTPVLMFNAHGWFNYALDHASELGFTNITGCVINGSFSFQ